MSEPNLNPLNKALTTRLVNKKNVVTKRDFAKGGQPNSPAGIDRRLKQRS